MASTFESWGSVGCEKSSKRVSRPRLSLSRHTNKVPIDSVDSTMKPVSILRMIFAISSVGLLFRDNYVVLVKSGPIRKDNQWVDHVEKLPDQSKDNQSMNNVESKDHQWVNNVTKMPNKSYPLVDYKPLRLKYGPGNPFRALNLVRTKNKLIDKNRLKKPQDQQAPSYQKAVICGCYKCGTTSFYSFLFQQIFDRPPPTGQGICISQKGINNGMVHFITNTFLSKKQNRHCPALTLSALPLSENLYHDWYLPGRISLLVIERPGVQVLQARHIWSRNF